VCSVVLVMSMDWLSPHGAAVAIPAALLLTVLVGVILGAINGTLIAYIGVNPFVVTLCTMLIFRGIAQILTGGGQTQQVHDILLRKRFDWFYDAGLRLCGGVGISMPILIFLVVFAVGIYLLRFTRFGHYVYAIGGNEEAAWLAGVNTHRIKALTYVLCGFTCAIAAVIFVAKTETAGAESHHASGRRKRWADCDGHRLVIAACNRQLIDAVQHWPGVPSGCYWSDYSCRGNS
ncbi:MAG: ABC transporter permease, partial [Planctomycetota bacterium]